MLGWFRWRTFLLGLMIFMASGLLMFAHFYLDVLVRAGTTPLAEPLLEELTAAFGIGLLFPWAVHFARRWPLDVRGWGRRLPAHALNVAGLSACHTTWNWLSRETLFPLAGLGDYDYGHLPTRYAMELPIDVLWYAVVVGFVYVFDRYRAAREREIQVAQLEARLTRAQLQNLQAQLNPHFLFNALNTISSVMYEDVPRSDRMIAALSDLLRRALHASARQEVTLAEELEALDQYLAIMRARFGEQLQVIVEADEPALDAFVPPLVLQPLVENAIRHGTPAVPGPARVGVRALVRDGRRLVLEVADNGPGLQGGSPPVGTGVGLTNTAERLRGLYGGDHTLSFENRPGGGLRVSVTIPLRVGDESTPRIHPGAAA